MPHPWSPGDSVQVRINDSWFDASVDTRKGNSYCCSLDAPIPTLADAGMTHPRRPTSAPLEHQVMVKYTPFGDDARTIRDPV